MIEVTPRTALINPEVLEEGAASANLVSGVGSVSNIAPSNIINFSLQPNSWLISCAPTAVSVIDTQIGTYVISDIFDLIPESELEDKVYLYEDKYGVSSKVFYQKWISGNFSDTPEANEWAGLWMQLRSYKDAGAVDRRL